LDHAFARNQHPCCHRFGCAADTAFAKRLVNQKLAARGMPPVKVTPKGRAVNLYEMAVLVGLQNATTYLRRLTAQAGGVAQSVDLVEAELAARSMAPLKRSPDGSAIGLLEAAVAVGLQNATPYLQRRAADAGGRAHSARLVDEARAARGLPALTRGVDGRVTALLEAAVAVGLQNATPYLQRRAADAGGRAHSARLVDEARAARGLPALTRDASGRAPNLLEAALQLDLDDATPYLQRLAADAGGRAHSARLVDEARAARGLPALTRDASGRATGIVEAALQLDLDDATPYLRSLAANAGGRAHSARLVDEARAARGQPALMRDVSGRATGIVEAALQLDLDDATPYLRSLAASAGGRAHSARLVDEARAARGQPALQRGADGRVVGLADAAFDEGLHNATPYLQRLAAVLTADRARAQAFRLECAAALLRDGLDRGLTAGDAAAWGAHIAAAARAYLVANPDGLISVFVAHSDRKELETTSQFSNQYMEHKMTFTPDVLRSTPAVRQRDAAADAQTLYSSNNPYNAFAVEAAAHDLLTDLRFPRQRLFKRVGAGGVNEATHVPGNQVLVLLLLIPRWPDGWTEGAQPAAGGQVGAKRRRPDGEAGDE
jgi:hypothetical protein